MQIEVISLIYKSVDYLNFIYNQMKTYCVSNEHEITLRIVANDPTQKVLDHLKTLDIPYSVYHDPRPDDYYLNRVYRCWNWAGMSSEAEYICFINSDMAFSNGWLDNLVKGYNRTTIPTSRLVESGKLLSGEHAISQDFGKKPSLFKQQEWQEYVDKISEHKQVLGGLYMPCLLPVDVFTKSKGYPEGNPIVDSKGNIMKINYPGVPHKGKLISGDKYYFDRLKTEYNLTQTTVFDSIVYHIQEGEKDENDP